MKVLLLAGGFGTRLSEETEIKPKPMVEIGGMPIIWHIMKLYSHYGFNEFVVLLGYKAYYIKEYFANYFLHRSDMTIDLQNNAMSIHHTNVEPWKITLIDTGLKSMTGARIKKAREYVGNETFMLTYGDGVSDVDIAKLLKYHKAGGKLATVTSVRPTGKFGVLDINNLNMVNAFREKAGSDEAWINAGFFALEPEIFDYIDDNDNTAWEKAPLENIANDKQLIAYKHTGFWRPMDTLRDKFELENLWESGKAPWKVW